ncbi:hypothetical protein [Parvibaculum sp.]|uniref:hypothetical protein n=1 Tax=Parvibaculum sp. TaxID=2024848 RepID=UPI0027307AB4|nr:hypothetical protein [Parvibaculum sp.]MDP1628396.1 hypothetical protein [Parvibaculum sp.]MDP2149885.1 hypothetical protein [Parvibaculum sp.]MDP3329509.1 hypothetical protein [Parvibaculum sp.]
MSLAADVIARHPALLPGIKRQAEVLLAAYDGNPRLSSIFATQQRWLMAHIGLALYFRRGPADLRNGLTVARFLDKVSDHGVASQNTADAFAREMLKYEIVRLLPNEYDRRLKPMEPTEATLDAIASWVALHLATLDSLDGGARAADFAANPAALAALQPMIAEGLLTLDAIREPAGTFSLFTWLNNGGVVMERMIAGLGDAEAGVPRVPTSIHSVAGMAEWLRLSRTHLTRKLREAQALGSIGWEGERGRSPMWVSADFLAEIAAAQAAKLAVIDAAYDACFGGREMLTD